MTDTSPLSPEPILPTECPSCHEPLREGQPLVCFACGWSLTLAKTPHRWDASEASHAGRKGGSARRRPKGMGKKRK